jgi:hypothetical protein
MFHPLIGQDGVFNLSPRFRPWRYILMVFQNCYWRTYDVLCSPKEHHVFDILHYIKAAFKKHTLDKINESDCLNKEAFW